MTRSYRKRILVTGGAGFIASHVVDAYIEAGHHAAVVDNLSTGSKKNLNPRATFYRADIENLSALRKIIASERPQIINHHAAQAAVVGSSNNPLSTYTSNVLGTINLLLLSPSIERFIFASTGGALYGELTRDAFTETAPLRPLSPYGLSKLLGEEAVRFYARSQNFTFVILRYGNVFGPRQNPNGEAGIVAIFSKLIAARKRPTIYNKRAVRDYVYVSDVARANVLALTKGAGESLNIGTGIATSNQEIFTHIAGAYGYKGTPIYKNARPGEISRSLLNASRARRILGWRPTVTLAQGIQRIHTSYA